MSAPASIQERTEVARIQLGNVLPSYEVKARVAILRWWGRLSSPVFIAGPFTANRRARRR